MKPLHDPIADALITLAYNKLLEEFEEPFEVEIVRGHREFRIISEQLAWSVKNNAHVLIEDLSRDDLLVAFQLMVGEAPVEYSMLGIEQGTTGTFRSVAAASGERAHVGWPMAGVREVAQRVLRGETTRMVTVHSHPLGALHHFLKIFETEYPGPSETDRDIMVKHLLRGLREQLVFTEFYLLEQGAFRPIRFPSWKAVLRFASQLHDLTTVHAAR